MKDFMLVTLLVTTVVSCIAYLGHEVGYDTGFRAGQIHALSGQSKYVLTTRPDGETRWAEKALTEKESK